MHQNIKTLQNVEKTRIRLKRRVCLLLPPHLISAVRSETILFRPEGKEWTPTQPTTTLLQVLGPDTGGHAVHAVAPAAIATV
jgi:hypothetical protein